MMNIGRKYLLKAVFLSRLKDLLKSAGAKLASDDYWGDMPPELFEESSDDDEFEATSGKIYYN